MKKEKDPIKKEDKKEDKFYSLFSKTVKHDPDKKKPEENPKKINKTVIKELKEQKRR